MAVQQQSGQNRRLLLQIRGMSCAGCVSRVEQALREVPGVSAVSVSLATSTAEVDLARADVSEQSLAEAVKHAGYEASPLEPDQLVETAEQAGTAHAAHHLRRFYIALILTMPILALEYLPSLVSAEPQRWLWITRLGQLVLTAALLGTAGRSILAAAASAAMHRTANMDVLISLGVLVAAIASAVGTVWPSGPLGSQVHFVAAGMIVTLVVLGRYLEARARGRTGAAIGALAKRASKTAVVVRDGQAEQVPIKQVTPGDIVRVAQDQYVPVDGTIVSGEAAIDESMLTGESVPVERAAGEKVFGGTLVRSGLIEVRAEGVGAASTLARIIRLVQAAQAGKTQIQRLADKAAAVFVPIVVAASAVTLVSWLLYGGSAMAGEAVSRAVAVLVVACPCALGLATPTAVAAATGVAALLGILVREPAALEAAGKVDTVIFDKTGTLTTGKMVLAELHCDPVGCGKLDEQQVLQLAASAEQYSEHPLAQALVAGAAERGITPLQPESYESFAGLGVRAVIGGQTVLVGSPKWMRQQGVDTQSAGRLIEQVMSQGQTPVLIVIGGRVAAVAGLADQIRPRAAEAIEALSREGIDVAMVTGDAEQVAAVVGASLGVQTVRAEVPPEGKTEQVAQFQRAGKIVAMVGDGINDAPALAAADVGIAFATGTEVACEAAQIALVGDSPMLVAEAIRLSRFALRLIKQNLFWAFFYNMAALPLAAFGVLPPEIAAGAMMASSLTVVGNALRLYRWAPADWARGG